MQLLSNAGVTIERTKSWTTEDYCESCYNDVNKGEPKYKWRLELAESHKYLHGMFWTRQCNRCINRTIDTWIESLRHAKVLVNE